MKRVVIYTRVSSADQNVATQRCDLRPLAKARGYEIVGEYTDTISGTKGKRPGLDKLMSDARRGRFDVVLVWAFDRMARSVRHFLEVLDELTRLNVAFISFRENVDTDSALGRAMIVIVAAISELEKSLIVERVKSGMRRAKLEGRRFLLGMIFLPRLRLVLAALFRGSAGGLGATVDRDIYGCSSRYFGSAVRAFEGDVAEVCAEFGERHLGKQECRVDIVYGFALGKPNHVR